MITCAPNFPEGKVYTGYKNRWYQVENREGVRVVRVKTFIAANAGTFLRILDFLSYMLAAFCAGMFQPRPDVVAATSPQFFAAVAGWALAKVRRVPFIFELSDLWPDSIVAVGAMGPSIGLRWLEKLELFLYHQAAAIIALTSAFKKNLVKRGIAGDKIGVVLNGVELDTFRPRPRDASLADELGLKGDQLVIGYIGTLGMAHGLENVLNAAVLTKGRPIRFMLVGPGAERERLLAEATRRGLDNVLIVPPQPKELMPAFWSLCDVALVHLKGAPLFKTVIPSKIFEAMGMGKPILLAAPEGEASELVNRAEAGLCISPGDAKGLAEAVKMFADKPAFRERLASCSLQAAPRYSRERQAREMLAIISRVVESGNGNALAPAAIGIALKVAASKSEATAPLP